MRHKISVVTLAVADVERARRFYVDGLGFRSRPESSERAVFLELEGVWLALMERDLLAKIARVDGHGSGFGGIVLSHNVATVEEVDEVVALAVAAGGRRHGDFAEPERQPGRIGYFADPDGYLWEVAHTPRWPELTA